MIFTVPLQPGTVLANVVYKWIISGAPTAPTSSGVTQPDTNFAVFRISMTPDPNAEEMIVYDSTNINNWNVAGYRAGLSAVAGAQQILLVNLWPGGAGPAVIIPAAAANNSICRCYGIFTNLSAVSADVISCTFTLVQVDAADPTIVYDMSSTLVKNRETQQLFVDRVVTTSIVGGQLLDVNDNPYVDLCRTDYIQDQNGANLPRMKYLMTCAELGAPMGLSMATSGGPAPLTPTTFVLDTSNLGVSVKGTFDISKLVPS
jgi:hypothetical protein